MLAWLGAVIGIMQDAATLLAALRPGFDLATAIGVQLDTVGTLIGPTRILGFQPSNGVSPVLDDTTYRLYLTACIFRNSWNGNGAALHAFWQTLFPGGSIVLQDTQNMAATVIMSGAFTSIIKDLITNGLIVPRPQAVQYTYQFATLPAFGFDSNNAVIAGFDAGHFV